MSPRNYFLYTPLLPAVATGTVEERSIVEPIRRIMAGKVDIMCCFASLTVASRFHLLSMLCRKVTVTFACLVIGSHSCLLYTCGSFGRSEVSALSLSANRGSATAVDASLDVHHGLLLWSPRVSVCLAHRHLFAFGPPMCY